MCGCLSIWGCVCLRLCLMCGLYLSPCWCGDTFVCVFAVWCVCMWVFAWNKPWEFVFEVVACGCPSLPLHNGAEPQLRFLLPRSVECNTLSVQYTTWTAIWSKSWPVWCSKWEVRAWYIWTVFQLALIVIMAVTCTVYQYESIVSCALSCEMCYVFVVVGISSFAESWDCSLFCVQIRAPPPISPGLCNALGVRLKLLVWQSRSL